MNDEQKKSRLIQLAAPIWKTWICSAVGHKEGNILHVGDFVTRTKCGRCQKNIVRSNTGLTSWIIDEA